MTVPAPGTSIQEFLYAFASGEADQAGEGDGWAPMMTWVRAEEALESTINLIGARRPDTSGDRPPLTGEPLRAAVERHDERTMTVVSLSEIRTITRCGICPLEDTRPCTALRVLALPYAQHPAYRPEWWVGQPDAGTVTVSPRPERVSELPPPGNARRRVLRQHGISLSPSDYTDEELPQRGIAVDAATPVPAN